MNFTQRVVQKLRLQKEYTEFYKVESVNEEK